MSKESWKEFALKNGMRACILCGEPTGRGCPGCEKVVCFKCSVAVDVTLDDNSGAIMWRCRACAAGIVLSGEGKPARIHEKEGVP